MMRLRVGDKQRPGILVTSQDVDPDPRQISSLLQTLHITIVPIDGMAPNLYLR